MFGNYMKTRLTAFLAVLVLPGGVFAAECLDAEMAAADPDLYPDETGYIVSIQADQGQGSISCGDFQGPGGPMEAVAITQEGGNGNVNSPILWSVSDPEGFSADLVFAASNDGKRCTQFYAGNAKTGNAGAGSKGGKERTLLACTDRLEEELPEPITLPTPPIITGDGCPDVFQDAIDERDDWDVLVVHGSDEQGGAEGDSIVCVDRFLNTPEGGNLLAVNENEPDLNRCVNRCVTPDPATAGPDWLPLDDPLREGLCTGAGPTGDGRFPIACRVCELTAIADSDFFEPELPFCWEQGQDVQPREQTNLPAGTFKAPPPDQGNQAWTVNGKFGSTCYLISGRTRSGYRYSYWAPSGCPN